MPDSNTTYRNSELASLTACKEYLQSSDFKNEMRSRFGEYVYNKYLESLFDDTLEYLECHIEDLVEDEINQNEILEEEGEIFEDELWEDDDDVDGDLLVLLRDS